MSRGFISLESPFGKALIGKEVGDVARVKAPGGSREYEIMEVSAYDWEAETKNLGAE
jgi:transcription elongation factor GreA